MAASFLVHSVEGRRGVLQNSFHVAHRSLAHLQPFGNSSPLFFQIGDTKIKLLQFNEGESCRFNGLLLNR